MRYPHHYAMLKCCSRLAMAITPTVYGKLYSRVHFTTELGLNQHDSHQHIIYPTETLQWTRNGLLPLFLHGQTMWYFAIFIFYVRVRDQSLYIIPALAALYTYIYNCHLIYWNNDQHMKSEAVRSVEIDILFAVETMSNGWGWVGVGRHRFIHIR